MKIEKVTRKERQICTHTDRQRHRDTVAPNPRTGELLRKKQKRKVKRFNGYWMHQVSQIVILAFSFPV